MVEVQSSENGFKKKYKYTKIKTVTGITKPVAVQIAIFGLGDKYISIVRNNDKRKFIVFVKPTVSEKTFNHFKTFWKDTFIVQKLSE